MSPDQAVDDGRELVRITHGGPVKAVVFSPDGNRIVAVADRRELAHITHDGPVKAVAFSPDGKYLATGSNDKTARLWSTALDDILHQLCAGHGRNLSRAEWHQHFGELPWQPTCGNWLTPPD